ncbi:MAG: TIGR00282 family metallophosphoesterase [Clostridia bacterium]
MKILAVGDLVGEGGVKKLKELLPKIREEEKIDFVIVNAENSAGGMGITTKIFNELKALNIDAMTMGNHTWGKKDIFTFIDDPKLLRPANYPNNVPGKGYGIYNCKGKKICVVNLIGRTDMNVLSENPFQKMQEILKEVRSQADIIILDFHAEATAEKIAMGYYLDGKITAMFGTHTHVQTADEKILEHGTGYITDIGMTGPIKAVIGMDIAVSIKRFETTLPERYKLAEGNCMLNGCIFDINDETCRVNKVTRVVRK